MTATSSGVASFRVASDAGLAGIRRFAEVLLATADRLEVARNTVLLRAAMDAGGIVDTLNVTTAASISAMQAIKDEIEPQQNLSAIKAFADACLVFEGGNATPILES